jgi:maltose alpha-D-glucosyltransferase/alpha-amylase
MMAEGGIVRERLHDYFGGQDGVQMLFNFPLVASLFLALARQEGEPLARGLELLPTPPERGQWTFFLRNLDELNLQFLSESERQDVFRAFAPEPEMRIYGRGIRRRLAPMLAGDRRRIELVFSLLLSLPGTPIIVYGDEIGMGEDLALPERQSVRTVMLWSAAPNAGFSTAPATVLTMPAIGDGPFGFDRVNVAQQERDQASLLHWFRRAIAVRKTLPELGRGTCRIVPTDDRRVVALCSSWQGQETVCMHNLSPEVCTVVLDLDGGTARLFDQFADQPYAPVADNGRVDLGPYGYRWLHRGDGDQRS